MGMMTALFAHRLAQHGILVYELRPGVMETDMTKPVKENYDRLIQEGMALIRRWGQLEDVARAVVAIAEGALLFSTGEVIHIDGVSFTQTIRAGATYRTGKEIYGFKPLRF
jgi:NAD(P)-dependent dehydrogenase (short-subunit alcohol dehydrogenase family)